VTQATAGQTYTYQASAFDANSDPLSYLLLRAPSGMTVNSQGLVSWTPSESSPERTTVVLRVYDSAGAYDTQSFTLQVGGTNRAPVFFALPAEVDGKEGQLLQIPVQASDADGDKLVYWADHLPAGATFDPIQRALIWTPDFLSAGTYEGVTFVVTDGLHQVSESTTVVIAPTPQPPTLLQPANITAQEGDAIRIALQASDPNGAPLTFSSNLLPPGAFLDPNTGVFQWTPDYTQHGVYKIPFTVSDGQASTTQTASIAVLNVNAPPVFQNLEDFQIPEGQPLEFRAQAYDPDNPTFTPPDRAADGTLVHSDLNVVTVNYTVDGKPQTAAFDSDTLIFDWTPSFTDAGIHTVTFTASDTGDGTGTSLSASQVVHIDVLNVNRAPQLIDCHLARQAGMRRQGALDILNHGLRVEHEDAAHADGAGIDHLACTVDRRRGDLNRYPLIAHEEVTAVIGDSQIDRESIGNRPSRRYQLGIWPERILDDADIPVCIERIGLLIEEPRNSGGIQTDTIETTANNGVDLIGAAGDEGVTAIRRENDPARVVNGELRVPGAREFIEVERNYTLLVRRRHGDHDAGGIRLGVRESDVVATGSRRHPIRAAAAGNRRGYRLAAVQRGREIYVDEATGKIGPGVRAIRVGVRVRRGHIDMQAIGRDCDIAKARRCDGILNKLLLRSRRDCPDVDATHRDVADDAVIGRRGWINVDLEHVGGGRGADQVGIVGGGISKFPIGRNRDAIGLRPERHANFLERRISLEIEKNSVVRLAERISERIECRQP
jgi:hypothetical protein